MKRILVILAVVFATASLWTMPVPLFDLDELTTSADQVVVGTVTSLEEQGRVICNSLDGRNESGRSMHGVIEVDLTCSVS
jgi:hypothetical protein